MDPALTLKDIARETGVSTMTVSRALRQDAKVARETRERIRKVAERLGYRPNPLVSALMSSRRARKPVHFDLNLGFITSFPARDGWKRVRLYREFFEGALHGADRHGYRLEEFWLGEKGMSGERLSQVLVTRGIRGVFLAPLPEAAGRVDLDWENLQAIAFGYSIGEPALHRVSNYQFRSMRLLAGRLRQLGYGRPGLALCESLDERVLHQWLGGFLVEQRQFAGRSVAPLVVPDAQWTFERIDKWLGRARPDVVIGQQGDLLEWIEQTGLRVPQDIGFVHLDCPSLNGRVSGIYQNGPEIGTAAADMLVGMLHRNERGLPALPRTLLIEGSWAQGLTTRSAKVMVS